MPERRDRAIVIGGSIAGLLAATALSNHFAEVVIIDRDDLPTDTETGPRARRGVPQSEQIHHLLSLGRDRIDTLVPGFDDELLGLGSEHFDEGMTFAQYLNGMWRVRAKTDLMITCFQRPVFEWVIRRRVLALSNVTTRRAVAMGLVGSAAGDRVVAVKAGGNEPELGSDLVVDATGRGSRAPLWIEDLGYARPREGHLRVYMGYSTFLVRFPDGALPLGLAGITCGSSREFPMGASVRPTDNGNHVVAAYGMMRHYPPTTMDDMWAFLETIRTPSIVEAIREAELLSDIRGYQMPGNQRRYWEEMSARPEGFVVLGDAVASFDPLYGQGMTLAAVGACELRDVLERTEGITGVAAAAQTGIRLLVDIAFDTAVGVDASFEGAEFENLDPPSPRSAAETQAFAEIQTEDVDVMAAARRATLYLDPSCLQAPDIQQRVQSWVAEGRTPRAEAYDPTLLPDVAPAYS